MRESAGPRSPRWSRPAHEPPPHHARGTLASVGSEHRLPRRRDAGARGDARACGVFLPHRRSVPDDRGVLSFRRTQRSEATLAVTTSSKTELLREHLGRDARSVEFLDANIFYSTPIAALEAYGAFLQAALERGAPWVRVVGEPIWAGRSDTEVGVWTRYESLFNLVFAASPLTCVCPYDDRSVAAEIVRHAHLTHPSTIDDRGISQSPEYTDPARLALEPR